MSYKVNDLFCGAGGMGLGFKLAGFELVGGWDIDKHAIELYKINVSSNVEQKDITKMSWNDLPHADVWTFGFPCQDLSNCGRKQDGLIKGERSRLFFEVMRLLQEIKENNPTQLPAVILAENVNDLKPYLNIVEEEYLKVGYKMKYVLYNSKFWGVPQNRERYFVIGVRDDLPEKFDFPNEKQEVNVNLETILEKDVDTKYFLSKEKTERIKQQVELGKISKSRGIICINPRKVDGTQTYQQDRVYDPKGIMVAVTAQLSGRLNIVVDKDRHLYRKLTPREFARLQGFPDTYKIVVSDNQAYKTFGNAVTVPVAKAIAEQIKTYLDIYYKNR